MIYKLKDRKREEFPIVCSKGCIAKILNSKPIFMADKIADLKKLKINSIRLIFTVEKFAQCDKIIDMYKRALNGRKKCAEYDGKHIHKRTFLSRCALRKVIMQ